MFTLASSQPETAARTQAVHRTYRCIFIVRIITLLRCASEPSGTRLIVHGSSAVVFYLHFWFMGQRPEIPVNLPRRRFLLGSRDRTAHTIDRLNCSGAD